MKQGDFKILTKLIALVCDFSLSWRSFLDQTRIIYFNNKFVWKLIKVFHPHLFCFTSIYVDRWENRKLRASCRKTNKYGKFASCKVKENFLTTWKTSRLSSICYFVSQFSNKQSIKMLNLFLFPFRWRRLLHIFNFFIASTETKHAIKCYGFCLQSDS